jgi:DNA-binding transcriptional ArsR family regulator
MDSERDGAELALDIRVGSGFEALAATSVLVSGDRTTGEAWPHRLPGHLTTEIIELTGDTSGELWLHLFAAATDLPGEPDLAAVTAWLAGESPARLRRVVVGADVPAWRQVAPAGILDAAAEGDPDAVAAMLADERHYAGRAAAALAVLAPLDPVETQRRLVAAVERLRPAIPPRLEAELLAAQRAFVRDHIPAERSDPLAVLDAAAGGFAWTPEQGTRRLVLVPHLAAAPQLLLLQHRDARVVGVAADDQESPSRLSTAYAALGDEQRLRILQLLAHRELGVSEVARELGIAKSTAHHHLAALRRAGLIRLVGQAWRYAYRAREDGPDRLATRLRLLLATPPTLDNPGGT